MSRFRYKAVDHSGATHRGVAEESDVAALRHTLRQHGLLPISIRKDMSLFVSDIFRLERSTARIGATDVAVFTRQMATLTSSGVPIETALGAIAKQSSPRLAAMCRAARTVILDGGSLSAALSKQGGRFDRFYLTSVRSGEQSGRLGAVLGHLAEHVETAQKHRQTVGLALIYPAILIAVSVAVVTALLVFVLPDIVRVFAARGADLPPLTKIMIAISDALSHYGLGILVGLALVALGCGALSRNPEVRKTWHKAVWKAGLARQIVLVQFTGTLSTLTQSGVTLTDALEAATATVGNLEAQSLLKGVARDVKEGAALSRALGERPGFPPMMITMIASGEASGTLPAMLGRFWADQSQNLQARVKTLVGLVEPLVLLGMGGIVMLLVLAILMPIVNLNALVG